MRRGDFENLLRRLLDTELNPRGFALTPQAPADFVDERLSAVFEADPDEFGERYPALDGRASGNTMCVDLWFHVDGSTGKLTSDLDGTSLDALLNRFHLPPRAQSPQSPESLESQVTALLAQILAILEAAKKA